jgi:hypothetical protein
MTTPDITLSNSEIYLEGGKARTRATASNRSNLLRDGVNSCDRRLRSVDVGSGCPPRHWALGTAGSVGLAATLGSGRVTMLKSLVIAQGTMGVEQATRKNH